MWPRELSIRSGASVTRLHSPIHKLILRTKVSWLSGLLWQLQYSRNANRIPEPTDAKSSRIKECLRRFQTELLERSKVSSEKMTERRFSTVERNQADGDLTALESAQRNKSRQPFLAQNSESRHRFPYRLGHPHSDRDRFCSAISRDTVICPAGISLNDSRSLSR